MGCAADVLVAVGLEEEVPLLPDGVACPDPSTELAFEGVFPMVKV